MARAWRAREKMPRPRRVPLARQSIQAAVYSHSGSEDSDRLKNSSSAPNRMSSVSSAVPGTCRSCRPTRKNHAGQSKTAYRRPEQACFRFRRAARAPSVAARQLDPGDVPADRAEPVVVLSVHVVGDRPSERHEAGAGRDREEPAAAAGFGLADHRQDVGQGHARLAFQDVRWSRSKADEPVQSPAIDQQPVRVQRDVAVGSAAPDRQRPRPAARRQRRPGLAWRWRDAAHDGRRKACRPRTGSRSAKPGSRPRHQEDEAAAPPSA